MEKEKFDSEVKTLKKFFEFYCKDNNHSHSNKTIKLDYKQNAFEYDFDLCSECYSLLLYSINRLESCPHEQKPKCRSCPAPCYEKAQWKRLAKIMKYSGMRLGFLKIKNIFKGKFD